MLKTVFNNGQPTQLNNADAGIKCIMWQFTTTDLFFHKCPERTSQITVTILITAISENEHWQMASNLETGTVYQVCETKN